MSAAADAELRWFFNEAEIAIDQPSNFRALLVGASPASLAAMERRAEAIHSARKIRDGLEGLRAADALLLCGLYTERTWSRAVARALPRGLAGAALGSMRVRAAHIQALAHDKTAARDVAAFIEEVVASGRTEVVAAWRDELELACASARRAYERARTRGPSVVPPEDP